jgi:hypothetical protein
MDFVQNVGRREIDKGGEIGAFVDVGVQSLNGYERNKLYRNVGARADGVPVFADFGYLAGADRIEDGRSVVAFDLERDGDLDIVLQSFERPAVLLVNGGEEAGHWLQVRLTGTRSNRDAIGARITATVGGRRQAREVASSAGYLAGVSLVVHFGLGETAAVDLLEVDWPSGARTVLHGVRADRRLELVEGAAVELPGS